MDTLKEAIMQMMLVNNLKVIGMMLDSLDKREISFKKKIDGHFKMLI